jgi:periplasmic divalent cation tolerance protein
MTVIFVYITVSSLEEAKTISHILITERLAGCVNIFPKMLSVYRWNNDVVEDTEVVMIAKTRSDLFETLSTRVRTLHSYETPAILVLPIDRVDHDYLKWLIDETSPSD